MDHPLRATREMSDRALARLGREGLTAGMLDVVKDLLTERRPTLRSGTIVDAAIIGAPNSTKNETKSRVPEMEQTKKGNDWHFGMELHIGTDRRGLAHGLTATHAAASDISQLEDLLHGEETVIWGDQACWKDDDREAFEEAGVRWRVNRRASGGNENQSESGKRIDRARSRTRARGEHPFRVVKQLWGFTKTRYRGIAKNLARAQTTFAFANLYAVRQMLIPPAARAAL